VLKVVSVFAQGPISASFFRPVESGSMHSRCLQLCQTAWSWRSALGTLETSARTPYPTSERAEEKGNGGRPYGDQLGFFFLFLPFAGIKKIQEVGVLRSCGVKLTQKRLRSLSCGEIASCCAAVLLVPCIIGTPQHRRYPQAWRGRLDPGKLTSVE